VIERIVKAVAKQPCLIAAGNPLTLITWALLSHPALGRKVSNEFTMPLCRGHHRELHRCCDETSAVLIFIRE
jgi:hypothetical protein